MQIGFTGSRKGMTSKQMNSVRLHLKSIRKKVEGFRHGDCIGADEQAHRIARGLQIPITIHPPDDDSNRAFCQDADRVLKTKPYIERNQDIVDRCDILLAAPNTDEEVLRSGTWATIRYARKENRRTFIFFRDGRQVEVNLKHKGG